MESAVSKGVGTAFIDDKGLGCRLPTSTEIQEEEELFPLLQSLAQQWERLLYSTSGALNLQKCFWFILAWWWTSRHATSHTNSNLPGSIEMTSGGNLEDHMTIHWLELTESYRTLGVWISPAGSNAGAIVKLTSIASDYTAEITNAHLTWEEAITTHTMHQRIRCRAT